MTVFNSKLNIVKGKVSYFESVAIETIPIKIQREKSSNTNKNELSISESFVELSVRITPEYSLERLMLKLKLQYFGYLIHWKRP